MYEPGTKDITFYFLAINQGAGLILASERICGGTRAVLVFDELVAIEAFRIIEELGSEWEVVERTPQEATFLLESCAEKGIRYVSVNAPTKLTRTQVDSELVPIWSFVDHLHEE